MAVPALGTRIMGASDQFSPVLLRSVALEKLGYCQNPAGSDKSPGRPHRLAPSKLRADAPVPVAGLAENGHISGLVDPGK